MDVAIQEQSTADAGSQSEIKHCGKAAPGPEARFAGGQRVDIVVYKAGQAKSALEGGFHVRAGPSWQEAGGRGNDAAFRVDLSARADTDGSNRLGRGSFQRARQSKNCL